MMSGDKLWVGTGGGRVLVLTYAPNVSDTGEAIRVLVKRKEAIEAEMTASSRSQDSGGILTTLTDTQESATPPAPTPDEEKWVHVENGEGVSPTTSVTSATSPGAQLPGAYRKRRRTQFGKTLRNKGLKQHKRKGSVEDVYQLRFLSCSNVVTAANDSVRVLIPVRSVGGGRPDGASKCIGNFCGHIMIRKCPE